MTASDTLRAALEKHEILYNPETNYIDDDWDRVETAILEAMQQHRAEALEEVYKWVSDNRNHAGITAYDYRLLLKAKIVAMKNSSAGKEK